MKIQASWLGEHALPCRAFDSAQTLRGSNPIVNPC